MKQVEQKKKRDRVFDALKQSIADGEYRPGGPLPSEHELVERFGFSRQTIRAALGRLKAEGELYAVQGKGSFVAQPAHRATKRVAHISIRINDYIFPSILRGIESVLAEEGYSLMLYSTANSLWNERRILQSLRTDAVDGIIISGTKSALPNPNIPLFQRIAASGIPLVFINSCYAGLDSGSFSYVVMDDYAGGYRLAELMIQQGMTNVGGIFKADDMQSFHRCHGFLAACCRCGVKFDDTNFLWFSSEDVRNYASIGAMLEQLRSCDALLCFNDEVVRSLLPELASFPWERLRYICSFDHVYPIALERIACISLIHPGEEMGRIAARQVLERIRGGPGAGVVLPWREPPLPWSAAETEKQPVRRGAAQAV